MEMRTKKDLMEMNEACLMASSSSLAELNIHCWHSGNSIQQNLLLVLLCLEGYCEKINENWRFCHFPEWVIMLCLTSCFGGVYNNSWSSAWTHAYSVIAKVSYFSYPSWKSTSSSLRQNIFNHRRKSALQSRIVPELVLWQCWQMFFLTLGWKLGV